MTNVLTSVDRQLRHRWRWDRERLHCMTPPVSPTLLNIYANQTTNVFGHLDNYHVSNG